MGVTLQRTYLTKPAKRNIVRLQLSSPTSLLVHNEAKFIYNLEVTQNFPVLWLHLNLKLSDM